ncbi:MAG: DegT/DnrJ/EryC1/StrS family aminotransferase, partial [Fimbriimonadales bacterium]|nr:DegT/DnrJ/EryC1/StrS family aminotransferase [Fimbriimonadales bacterium]
MRDFLHPPDLRPTGRAGCAPSASPLPDCAVQRDTPLDGQDARPDAGVHRELFEASAAGRGAVAELEQTLADAVGVPYALATASGTLALYFALRAVGVRVGDIVVVPAYDWYAATAAVLHSGAIPYFVDVQLDSATLSPHALRRVRPAGVRAVIVTHLFGNPADLPALRRWCDQHGIALIEDLSHALGATCAGKPVGAWGDLACLSLTFSKPVHAGEGGVILTRSEALYDRLLALCAHPLRQSYAGLEPNPYALRAPLNPLGFEVFLSCWEAFPQYRATRQRLLWQLTCWAKACDLGVVPLRPARPDATATGYRLCLRLRKPHLQKQVLHALEASGWQAGAVSGAFEQPSALRRALQAGYWQEHPCVEALHRAAQTRCPNARTLHRELICV